MIPQPGWLTEEPDKWPDDAREFYRLCHAILKRGTVRESAPVGDEGRTETAEDAGRAGRN